MSNNPPNNEAEFDEIAPSLALDIKKRLERELVPSDGAPNLDGSDKSDLWSDMPQVDSKTVMKVSGVVKNYLGIPLDPKIVKKGGYHLPLEQVVEELMNCLKIDYFKKAKTINISQETVTA